MVVQRISMNLREEKRSAHSQRTVIIKSDILSHFAGYVLHCSPATRPRTLSVNHAPLYQTQRRSDPPSAIECPHGLRCSEAPLNTCARIRNDCGVRNAGRTLFLLRKTAHRCGRARKRPEFGLRSSPEICTPPRPFPSICFGLAPL
jgi:hypothetical protein